MLVRPYGAQESDCISAASRHSRGEDPGPGSHETSSPTPRVTQLLREMAEAPTVLESY